MRKVPWWKIILNQEEANSTSLAINAGKLSQGSITAELEAKLSHYLNVPYVTMTTSGSVALLMSLLACGVKPGDEVIVPNRTFIATAHAPLLIGAKVKLVDTIRDLPLIDPEEVEKKITEKTKAIIPVHLNGRACNMKAIRKIANKKGIYIIEDAAQAMFSKFNGKYLGTLGDFGCFSLGVTKLITSGQGGFVVTNDKDAYEKLNLIRTHGGMVNQHYLEKFNHFGFNFRYSDIQASLALKQIEKIPAKLKAHNELYKRYESCLKGLKDIRLLDIDIDNGETPLWIEVVTNKLDQLLDYLKKNNIEAKRATPNINESPHLHDISEFSNSTRFWKEILILPSGPDQHYEDIEYTFNTIKSFFK